MSIRFIVFLLVLFSCGTAQNDLPIEIYRMSNVDFSGADCYVIYNHKGKSDTAIINSVIDFNRRTMMNIDSILRYDDYYCRRFYKQDKDLTRDYKEDGPEAIRDYAERCFIHLNWSRYTGKHSDTIIRINGYIMKKKLPEIIHHWKSGIQPDSSLLNPIPRW